MKEHRIDSMRPQPTETIYRLERVVAAESNKLRYNEGREESEIIFQINEHRETKIPKSVLNAWMQTLNAMYQLSGELENHVVNPNHQNIGPRQFENIEANLHLVMGYVWGLPHHLDSE